MDTKDSFLRIARSVSCWLFPEKTGEDPAEQTTPALSMDQVLKKESSKRSMLRWPTDHTEGGTRCKNL